MWAFSSSGSWLFLPLNKAYIFTFPWCSQLPLFPFPLFFLHLAFLCLARFYWSSYSPADLLKVDFLEQSKLDFWKFSAKQCAKYIPKQFCINSKNSWLFLFGCTYPKILRKLSQIFNSRKTAWRWHLEALRPFSARPNYAFVLVFPDHCNSSLVAAPSSSVLACAPLLSALFPSLPAHAPVFLAPWPYKRAECYPYARFFPWF